VPKIYFDVCCLNRPFDDQNQTRIRLEAEAILMALNRCEAGDWKWIGSEVIDFEIKQIPDPERRRRTQALASHAREYIVVGKAEFERAQQLEAWNISAFDALHLACAESGGADIFLTTDDRLLHKAAAYADQLHIRVENPLTWLREVG
jgi:predicted nucleic acid-binding protein